MCSLSTNNNFEQIVQNIANDVCDTVSFESRNMPSSRWIKKFQINQIFNCDMCSKVFSNSIAMRSHLRSHQFKKECHVCGKFIAPYHYQLHMDRIHPINGVPCDECALIFPNKTEQRNHKNVHKKRQNQNSIASNQYAIRKCFKNHKSIKNDEIKMYDCTLCSRQYVSEKQLVKHYHYHNMKVQKAIFARPKFTNKLDCDICFKKFRSRKRFLGHKEMHRDTTQIIENDLVSETVNGLQLDGNQLIIDLNETSDSEIPQSNDSYLEVSVTPSNNTRTISISSSDEDWPCNSNQDEGYCSEIFQQKSSQNSFCTIAFDMSSNDKHPNQICSKGEFLSSCGLYPIGSIRVVHTVTNYSRLRNQKIIRQY